MKQKEEALLKDILNLVLGYIEETYKPEDIWNPAFLEDWKEEYFNTNE